jgi:hypothetical protein
VTPDDTASPGGSAITCLRRLFARKISDALCHVEISIRRLLDFLENMAHEMRAIVACDGN